MTLQTLSELARGATPGPWREKRCDWAGEGQACGVYSSLTYPRGEPKAIVESDAYDECSHVMRREDARFIAACSPEVVIALCRVAEAAAALQRELDTPFTIACEEASIELTNALTALEKR